MKTLMILNLNDTKFSINETGSCLPLLAEPRANRESSRKKEKPWLIYETFSTSLIKILESSNTACPPNIYSLMSLLLFWADFLKIVTFGPHVTNVFPVYSISFYDVHGSDGWSDSKQWINFPGLPFDNSVYALMTILQVWYQTQLPVMLWSWKFLKNVPSAKLLLISAKIVFNL